ncbi:hypothetical protein K5I29_03175 [Flavobacterium agricola]|uniref:Uncharacterized protein n=1 Tax=Flavobacterium agricola TaxID=2870839 RepID=A0ABY6M085_9FLAO|nr:hypothetical protein [Flavobacterium agricola]UYW01931.1 hypothetical protein K5I29_03175 [Flavobacterium agricola]
MKKILQILLLTFSVFIAACTSTDDFDGITGNGTTVTIKLIDSKGLPIRAIPVYAFSIETWVKNGGEAADMTFADFTVKTNNNGIAEFGGFDTEVFFNTGNNFTNIFTFVVEYEVDGITLRKIERATLVQNSYNELVFTL